MMLDLAGAEFDFIQAISVLQVKDGDTIVITTDRTLNYEQRTALTELLRDRFQVPILVLDSGTELRVVWSKPEVVA